jgi:aspartate-semialdehyde dehydrogenase
MPLDRDRIVIAGASSLLGAELKSLLEESRFAASDFRLLDEELAAGTLTEAGGEAAIIQAVEEGSFDRAKFIFFTGSPGFTFANLAATQPSGATIIDLSGVGTSGGPFPRAAPWFSTLDALRGTATPRGDLLYAIPTAAGIAVSALALGLVPVGLQALVVTCLLPVSEAGRAGIEELESQTSQLLSFQSVGKPVFDTQVAFTLLDRFGPRCTQVLTPPARGLPFLTAARRRVRHEVQACLAGSVPRPAVQVLHAPVFYGTTFSAWAQLEKGANIETIQDALKKAGFAFTDQDEGPSNVSVAGENLMQLAPPEIDPAEVGTWWLWGAADNIRLPAANAVKLAERLAASS